MKIDKFIVKNFDSSFRGNYKGYHIDPRLVSKPNSMSPIVQKINSYNNLQKIGINRLYIGLNMYDSISFINKKIQNIYIETEKIRKNKIIKNLSEYNNEKANIIHVIKRIIDDLITTIYIHNNYNEILSSKKIKILSIGQLYINEKDDALSKEKKQQIQTELNYDKYKDFLDTINDLHNAYKHSYLENFSRSEIPAEGEAFFVDYVKNGNLENIYYLCHKMIHIIIAFSDFLLEFCGIEKSNRVYTITEKVYTNP